MEVNSPRFLNASLVWDIRHGIIFCFCWLLLTSGPFQLFIFWKQYFSEQLSTTMLNPLIYFKLRLNLQTGFLF